MQRIQEDAQQRQELWYRGEAAKTRNPRRPLRQQVARLSEALEGHFGERRAAQVGQMPPGNPTTSGGRG